MAWISLSPRDLFNLKPSCTTDGGEELLEVRRFSLVGDGGWRWRWTRVCPGRVASLLGLVDWGAIYSWSASGPGGDLRSGREREERGATRPFPLCLCFSRFDTSRLYTAEAWGSSHVYASQTKQQICKDLTPWMLFLKPFCLLHLLITLIIKIIAVH